MFSTTLVCTCLVERSFAPTTGHLAYGPATRTGIGQRSTLCIAHFGPLPAHVGLVDFERPVVVIVIERLADALEHVPRGLLRDADVPVELNAGNTSHPLVVSPQKKQPCRSGCPNLCWSSQHIGNIQFHPLPSIWAFIVNADSQLTHYVSWEC